MVLGPCKKETQEELREAKKILGKISDYQRRISLEKGLNICEECGTEYGMKDEKCPECKAKSDYSNKKQNKN